MDIHHLAPVRLPVLPGATQAPRLPVSLLERLDMPLVLLRADGIEAHERAEIQHYDMEENAYLSGCTPQEAAACIFYVFRTLEHAVPGDDALDGWYDALCRFPGWSLREASLRLIAESPHRPRPADFVVRANALVQARRTAQLKAQTILRFVPMKAPIDAL